MSSHAGKSDFRKEISARAAALFYHRQRPYRQPVFNTVGRHGEVTRKAVRKAYSAITIEHLNDQMRSTP